MTGHAHTRSTSEAVYVGTARGVEVRRGVHHSALRGGPFGWGRRDARTDALACALLADALGDTQPLDELVHAFAREVVARLPADGFRLTAEDVVAWVVLLGSDPDDDLRQDQVPAGIDSVFVDDQPALDLAPSAVRATADAPEGDRHDEPFLPPAHDVLEQVQTVRPSAPGGPGHLVVPVGQDDHVTGPADAAVTLVEYGDFQCPYCAQAHRDLQTIRQSGNVRIVWRHHPIAEVHPRAEPAAVAAEAAGRQARFWEMHDLLFADPRRLGDNDLVDHAGALGLDLDRFRDDLADDSTLARVRTDARGGLRSGIRGTPSFFVNGQLDVRPWPVILASLPRQLRR